MTDPTPTATPATATAAPATPTAAPATATAAPATPTTAPATPATATIEPAATAAPATPTGTPAVTPEVPTATATPDASPVGPGATEQPEETGSGDAGTPSPSPSVAVTPGPGGAVRIASNVRVVGNLAAYNRTGTQFVFTARPADGSAGPDVYVWNTDEPEAHAVTDDHRSVFAGWHSGHLVVSRLGGTDAGTYLMRTDGTQVGERVSHGWLPTISPDKSMAAWWVGEVAFGSDGVTPVTGKGKVVLGPWEGPGATQTLVEGPVDGWTVRWDPSGSVVAVWVAGASDTEPGSLSLYRVNEDGRTVDLEHPLRANEPAFGDFGLDKDHLAWRATGKDGAPVVRVIAWNGDDVGIVELPAEAGSSIVR